MLLTISINDIDKGTKCTLSKFADDPKLRGAVDTPQAWDVIQRDLVDLENCAHGNLMRFNKARCTLLYLGQGNLQCQHRQGDERIQSSSARTWWCWWMRGWAGTGTATSESKLYPGLRQKNCGQHGQGRDSAPLLRSSETPPGVLHPAMGSPARA
ncbi:hypothetical protein TURU_104984 [Turdus rufiventris]|nr:hypothetical protein TURU_104984 [Turdus rufiventris]